MPSDERPRLQPPPGVDPSLFSYLQDSFAGLSGQMAESVTLSRRAIDLGQENAKGIARLNWHVFGPKGPPSVPPPNEEPGAVHVPVVQRITNHDHDAAAAEGREIARDARVKTVALRVEAVEKIVQKQSEAMGLVPVDKRTARPRLVTRAFLESPSGRKFMLQIATLVLAAATTILSAFAARGALTPAAAPAPAAISEGAKR